MAVIGSGEPFCMRCALPGVGGPTGVGGLLAKPLPTGRFPLDLLSLRSQPEGAGKSVL